MLLRTCIDHTNYRDTPLPLIAQSLTYVADDSSKLPTLLQYLSQPYNPPVLIFTSTQPRAASLAEELVLSGTPNVDCLHAGMSRKEREDAVSRMRRGESWIRRHRVAVGLAVVVLYVMLARAFE